MRPNARWMTRDFVFAAPAAFPHVVAVEPERFSLSPAAEADGSPVLFVAALQEENALNLDARLASIARDVLGFSAPADWSVEPKQLFGRDARQGLTELWTGQDEEAAEIVLVRGEGDRPWVFARRSSRADEGIARPGLVSLLQGLQERLGGADAKLLRRQFHGQERKRLGVGESGTDSGKSLPDPADPVWERRFAAAMAAGDVPAVAPMIADAVALLEEPYGDPVSVGASRIGGGPDLPPGAWPTDARGMRHPFLMQIDHAEVASACGAMPPLPEAGMLSFFVHGDGPMVEAVYSPPDASLISFPMTRDIVEASHEAVRLVGELPEDIGPGPLPHEEGDYISASIRDDGTLRFSHSPDPAWAYGTPGAEFEALSDERWACVASARLRPVRTRSIDFAAAQMRIEEEDVGSMSDLEDLHADLHRAPAGARSDIGLPQIHQMLGYASLAGGRDCRKGVAGSTAGSGYAEQIAREDWMVLARVNAGSATGREFWDALDLTVMAPKADVAARRWDRCVLLAG